MAFFKIQPQEWLDNWSGAGYFDSFYLSLHVIIDDAVNVTPDPNVNVTDLNTSSSNKKFKNFTNTGDGGITFTVSVIIPREERWERWLWNGSTNEYVIKNPRVTDILKQFINEMTVLAVKTDAIDIPNGKYIITKNSSRKQALEDNTVWKLEFTTYRPLKMSKYSNSNKVVKNAISQSQKKANKQNTNKRTGKSASTTRSKLKKCKLKNFKYSKTKTTTDCNRLMQKVLYQKKYLSKSQVDGWFGPKTKDALKSFQRKYKKTYKLKANGKVDKNTLNALCKV